MKNNNKNISAVGESRFIRNSALLISIELAAKFLGLILFVLIARTLGASDTGLFSYGTAVANLFAILPQFGFERRAQKEVSRNEQLLFSYSREILFIKLIFSCIAMLMTWAFLLTAGENQIPLLLMITSFVFLYSFVHFINALFRAVGRPEFEVLVRIIFSVLNLGLGAYALLSGWGIIGVVTTQLTSASVGLIIGFIIITRISLKTEFSLSFDTLKEHIIKAAPFALSVLVLYQSNQVNYIFLKMMSSEASVGYFSTADRIFSTLTLIPAAIMGAFLPMMSKLHTTSVSRFVRALHFTMKYLFIIAIPILAGTWVTGERLAVILYGKEFLPTGIVLMFLNTSLVFSFWNYACSAVLIARNKEKLVVALFAMGAVTHIVGNLALIHFFSHVGAGVAVVVTQGVQFLIFFLFLRKYFRLGRFVRTLIGPTLSAGIMVVGVWLVMPFNVFVAIAVGAIIYLIMLIVTGSIHRRDVSTLNGTIKK